MKYKAFKNIALLATALAVGCGRPPPAAPVISSAPTDAEIAITMNGTTQVVQVTADDTMHYNGDRFTVKTGQPVEIQLTNTGHRPRTEMAHNFIILKPGTDVAGFNLLSAQDKTSDYVPTDHDQAAAIVAHTSGLVGPGETSTVDFTAPAPGQYPFLCNFPGHYAGGMHGTMTVAP